MWPAFILENAHFALFVFASLVCFGIAWLYFDAWKLSKRSLELIRSGGFILLSISFCFTAIYLETSIFSAHLLSLSLHLWLIHSSRVASYLLIFISIIFEKLQKKPTQIKKESLAILMPIMTPLVFLQIFEPIVSCAIAFYYLRRATKGLERHVFPIAFGFVFLSFAELIGLSSLFRETTNSFLYELVAPLGILWISEHIFVLFATLILGRWIFGYLLKQFQTQLFMIFSIVTLGIFLVTTIAFTGLLTSNIQEEALHRLESDAKTLEYALTIKQDELVSDTEFIAQNSEVVRYIQAENKSGLTKISEQFLTSKNINSIMFANEEGVAFLQVGDTDTAKNSLDTPIVSRIFHGESLSSITASDGTIAPDVSLLSGVPIYGDGKTIVGTVIVRSRVDTAFVDGIKKATGLDASVYGDMSISATTLASSNQKDRLIGIIEPNRKVKESIYVKQKVFSGISKVENTDYFMVYIPLFDVDHSSVGMLGVGRPQYETFQTAGKSIELTFITCLILLLVSIFPSYAISKYLASQLN